MSFLARKSVQILLQSKDFLVVNKPPLSWCQIGVENSKVKSLAEYFQQQYPSLYEDEPNRPYHRNTKPLIRLDYPATGAAILVNSQLEEKGPIKGLRSPDDGWKVQPTYLAIVSSTPQEIKDFSKNKLVQWVSDESGIIRKDILGDEAATRFKILDSHENTSLLSLKPLTASRKHQMRRHLLDGLGTCILGDDHAMKKHHDRPIALHAAQVVVTLPDLKIGVPAPIIHTTKMWTPYPQALHWGRHEEFEEWHQMIAGEDEKKALKILEDDIKTETLWEVQAEAEKERMEMLGRTAGRDFEDSHSKCRDINGQSFGNDQIKI